MKFLNRFFIAKEFGLITKDQTAILKGIGILAILFHNYFHWVIPSFGENEFEFSVSRVEGFLGAFPCSFPDAVNLAFSFLGHFGVQIFIFISGYGLARSVAARRVEWSDFFVSRLQKLYPTYLVSVMILIVLMFYNSSQLPDSVFFHQVWRKIVLVSNLFPREALSINGPWWFYSLIVQLYLLFPLVLYLIKRSPFLWLVVLLSVSYILLWFVNPLLDETGLNLWQNAPGHIPEFAFGVFLATKPKIRFAPVVYIIALVVFCLSNFYKQLWPFGFIAITIVVVGFYKLLSSLGTGHHILPLKKTLIYYGNLSMFLFAIHGFLRAPFVKTANNLEISWYTFFLAIAFFIVSTVAAEGVRGIVNWFAKFNTFVFKRSGVIYKIVSWLIKPQIVRVWSREWLIFLIVLLALCLGEFFWIYQSHGLPIGWGWLIYDALTLDLVLSFKVLVIGFFLFRLFVFANIKMATITYRILLAFFMVISVLLIAFYRFAMVPLDEVVLTYSLSDMFTIASNSVNGQWVIWAITAGSLLLLLVLYKYFKYVLQVSISVWFALIGISVFLFNIHYLPESSMYKSEGNYHLVVNKLAYFADRLDQARKASVSLQTSEEVQKAIQDYRASNPGIEYTDDKYPFWHTISNDDVLGPFINKKSDKFPNFVFIIVESLGRDISGPEAVRGNFTPFIDSLAGRSLYWPNFLSTSERTFGVLPALLGSLPYGRDGFAEMGDMMPDFFSLPKILKGLGYDLNFFYGGDPVFNNMSTFLQRSDVNIALNNQAVIGKESPTPDSPNSWGWDDVTMFRKAVNYLEQKVGTTPRLDVYLTLSTHTPFDIPDHSLWKEKAEANIAASNIEERVKDELQHNIIIPASFLFTDRAVANLIDSYKNFPDFDNTIFIITGDHREGDLPAVNRLSNYNVPFLIWSPMLKSAHTFNGVSSHLDVTPSVLGFLKQNYHAVVPSEGHWLGDYIDTSAAFNCRKSLGFMSNSRSIDRYLDSDTLYANDAVYLVGEYLSETKLEDKQLLKRMSDRLAAFDAVGIFACDFNALIQGKALAGSGRILELKTVHTDFEGGVDSYYKPQLSDVMAFSGTSSLSLNSSTEYGGLLQGLSISNNINSLSVSVSAKMFIKSAPGGKLPGLVISVIGKDNEVVFYKFLPLAKATGQPLPIGEWTDYSYFFKYDLKKLQNHGGGMIKVYLWNVSKGDMWYDDLDVSVTGE